MTRYFTSTVPRHEGPCVPVWLNTNRVSNRFDGGVTGFFRRVYVRGGIVLFKFGPQFHAIIRDGRTVESTTRYPDNSNSP